MPGRLASRLRWTRWTQTQTARDSRSHSALELSSDSAQGGLDSPEDWELGERKTRGQKGKELAQAEEDDCDLGFPYLERNYKS